MHTLKGSHGREIHETWCKMSIMIHLAWIQQTSLLIV